MKAKEILDKLTLPLQLAERVTTMSVLQHLRFHEGKAIGMSAEATVEVDCPVDISCCPPAKRLSDALNAIAAFAPEAEVKFHQLATKLELKAARLRYTMPTLATAEYPVPTWPEKSEPITTWPAVAAAITFAQPFAARDDVRKYLIGVAFVGRDVAGSNGNAAAIARGEGPGDHQCVIPLRSVPAVRALPPASAYTAGDTKLALTFEGGRMDVRLLDGRFPEIQRFIPSKHIDNVARIEREALKRAVEAITKTQEAQWTRLLVNRGSLRLEDEGGEASGSVEIEISYDGPELNVGLNLSYLAAAVAALDGEHVHLSCEGALKPMLLTGKKESRSIVIMPARL